VAARVGIDHELCQDHHVARTGGEHVGDVEPARAAEHGRHALLEQQALDELGLRLVARAGDADEVALGELPLDLARALAGGAHRPVEILARRMDERQAAVRAEALVGRVGRRAPRADELVSRRRRSPPPR
jgi:hypothetical protein